MNIWWNILIYRYIYTYRYTHPYIDIHRELSARLNRTQPKKHKGSTEIHPFLSPFGPSDQHGGSTPQRQHRFGFMQRRFEMDLCGQIFLPWIWSKRDFPGTIRICLYLYMYICIFFLIKYVYTHIYRWKYDMWTLFFLANYNIFESYTEKLNFVTE